MSNLFDDEFLLQISSSMEAKMSEYDWLGAIEVLKEGIKYVLNKRDFLKCAELWENKNRNLNTDAFKNRLKKDLILYK